MTSYLLFLALIAGLLMYLLIPDTKPKAVRIGEMLLFASIVSLAIALGPATVKLLHG